MVQSKSDYLESWADLFQTLAEALYEPADWLERPGREWPLTTIASQLARQGSLAENIVASLTEIPGESLTARRTRYAQMFHGFGQRHLSLSEGMYLHGRLLTAETASVERYYRAAGLEVSGAELPDHASVELAFLAELYRRQANEPDHASEWIAFRRQFMKAHASRWLPALGNELSRTSDLVYGPLGRLLTIAFSHKAFRLARSGAKSVINLPLVQNAADCSLCGFCVQACPTGALSIHETRLETQLWLSSQRCTACGKCLPLCPTKTLQIGPARPTPDGSPLSLQSSIRLNCPGCGEPTVSEAELNFVRAQIGPAPWLAYCLRCRTGGKGF